MIRWKKCDFFSFSFLKWGIEEPDACLPFLHSDNKIALAVGARKFNLPKYTISVKYDLFIALLGPGLLVRLAF